MRTGFHCAFLLLASAAFACSCDGPTPACSVYWTTPVVFVGHVTSQQLIDDRYEVHFYVAEPLKGVAGKEIVVRTYTLGGRCGFGELEKGSEYLVYAYSQDGEWWTNICTGTHKIESVNDDADVQWIRGLAKAPPGGTIFGAAASVSPGRGMSPDVSPLTNLKVTVTGPISQATNTDNTGQFRITALPPGTYTVSAVAPTGYVAFSWSPTKVQLHDRGCAEVPFFTELNGHITGHVYFSNGVPAAGLAMTAENIDTQWSSDITESGNDGSFDFSPLPPAQYIFGLNIYHAGGDRYYRKAFYPGVSEQSQAALVQLGPAQKVDNLRFFLPQDLPAPSIPLQVTVLGRDGKPIPNAQISLDDDMWENQLFINKNVREADSEGKVTLLLRKGAYYNVWAYVILPDRKECAVPVGVLVDEGLKPVTLIVSHPIENCLFKKSRH